MEEGGWGPYMKRADDEIKGLRNANHELKRKIIVLEEILKILKNQYEVVYKDTELNKISLVQLEPYISGVNESCKEFISNGNDNRFCRPEELKTLEEQWEIGLEIIRRVREFFEVSE